MATSSVTTVAVDEKSISGDVIRQLRDSTIDINKICPAGVKLTNFNAQTNRWEVQGPDDKIREFHRRIKIELIKQELSAEDGMEEDNYNSEERPSARKKRKRHININAKQGDLSQEPVEAIVCPTGKTMPVIKQNS